MGHRTMNMSFQLEYRGWLDITFRNEEKEFLIPGSTKLLLNVVGYMVSKGYIASEISLAFFIF